MAWTLYKEIKYALDGIPDENLTIDKLVTITGDADIASELSGGGGVKFTSPDGMTDLSFGLLATADLANGTIVARVLVSLLTAANVDDVICRLYYSADESTTQDRSGAMPSDMAMYMPLEEDPSDSAPQSRDWVTDTLLGTANGSMVVGDLVSGQVSKGLQFEAVSSQNVSVGDYWQLPLTIACWIYLSGSVNGAIVKVGGINDGVGLGFGDGSSMSNVGRNLMLVRGGKGFNDSGLTIPDGWSFVSCVVDSDIKFTVNGSSATVSLGTVNSATAESRIGGYTAGRYLSAIVDEVRIADSALSDNLVAYRYQDENANGDTFTLSEEQGGSGSTFLNTLLAHNHFAGGVAL